MTFGELLLELKSRATAVLIYIWNQDYSVLEKKMLGVSIIDLAAIFFACFILWEIVKAFITMTGNILKVGGQLVLSYILNVVLVAARTVFLRAWYTADYLWHTERVQYIRYQVEDTLSRFFTRILHRT